MRVGCLEVELRGGFVEVVMEGVRVFFFLLYGVLIFGFFYFVWICNELGIFFVSFVVFVRDFSLFEC